MNMPLNPYERYELTGVSDEEKAAEWWRQLEEMWDYDWEDDDDNEL